MSCKRKPGLLPHLLPLLMARSNTSPASQQNASTSVSPETSDNKNSQSQDVDMETPDSPPETSHASSSSQVPPTPTQANTSGGRVNGEGGGSSSSSNTKANFGAPGSCWQTKKFNEEYEKAEANLLDRGWESEFQPRLDLGWS